MSEQRPRLKIEKIMAGEMKQDFTFPHCEARILHAPDEKCLVCSGPDMQHLHEEREQLGVNYSGRSDRPFPCPVDQARSSESYNKWGGNTVYTEEHHKQAADDLDEAFEAFDKEDA